jgi:hypothetical protein
MVGIKGWSGQVRKISPPPGFDLQTVQPIVCERERGREKKRPCATDLLHTLYSTNPQLSSTHLVLTAPASLNYPHRILKVGLRTVIYSRQDTLSA